MIKAARFQRAVTTLQGTVCVLALTVIGLALLPGPARAATDTTDYTRPGLYLGLGASGGLEDFGGGRSAFGDSAGFTFRVGYRLAPYFAVEGLYEYMDDFGFATTTLTGRRARVDIRTDNFSLMGKAILPLGFVQPYLSGGVGFLNADSTAKLRGLRRELRGRGFASEFAGRVGAGLDLFATPQLALTLDSGYVLPTDRLEDFNYISFGMGVRYTF
jgi:Outer membrane protein beta-barrel domain